MTAKSYTFLFFLVFTIGVATGYLYRMEQTKPIIKYCLTGDGDIGSINEFLEQHPKCRTINVTRFCGLKQMAFYECEE